MQTISLSNNFNLVKSFLVIVSGTALLAISSKIQTPFTLVPATMQTFVVLFLGMALGYKLATATVVLYLIEGSIGLPVFAKGGGFAYLMGPTGGYLIGFIVTAFFSMHIDCGFPQPHLQMPSERRFQFTCEFPICTILTCKCQVSK